MAETTERLKEIEERLLAYQEFRDNYPPLDLARALQASQERERKLRRLLMTARAQAENGLRCSVLTDWYREGTDLLKEPTP
jgi:acyl transferase domain-containing protein